MNDKKIIKIYLYTRYERFWHWLQALMIMTLIVTGFEIHGTYTLLGFQRAVNVHNFIGLSWLVLFAFFCLLAVHHRGVEAICSHH